MLGEMRSGTDVKGGLVDKPVECLGDGYRDE